MASSDRYQVLLREALCAVRRLVPLLDHRDEVRRQVLEGGFSKVAVEQDEVTFEFDSPEHFTAYVRAISAPIRAMIEHYAGEA